MIKGVVDETATPSIQAGQIMPDLEAMFGQGFKFPFTPCGQGMDGAAFIAHKIQLTAVDRPRFHVDPQEADDINNHLTGSLLLCTWTPMPIFSSLGPYREPPR